MRRIVIGIIIVIVLVAGGWYFLHGKSDKEDAGKTGQGSGGHGAHGAGANAGPLPVNVASVKTGNINIYLNALGNVTPRNTVTVHTRVDGELDKLLFREGQMVKAGDPLAELDPRPYQAQLEQAQGQMTRDQALLKDAILNLKRYKLLFKQDSIARQQVDTQASLVIQYEGAVKNDAGLIDAAKTNLIYTSIKSPVSGRVGLRQVDPGNIVHSSDSNGIVVVTQLQPITVLFTLPEDSIGAVMEHTQNNEKLSTEAWDRDNKNKLATGKLTAIDNQVDTTTGTIKLRAEFANKDNKLFPSQFVNTKLLLETKQNILLMPTAATQRGTQGTFVYLVKPDSTAHVQPVKLGAIDGDNVMVESGLNEGDQVVTDGGDSLREGAKVTLPEADKGTDKNGDKSTAGADDKKDKPADNADATGKHKHKKHSDGE